MRLEEVAKNTNLSQEQIDWLQSYGIAKYTADANGKVYTHQGIDLILRGEAQLPVRFGVVRGSVSIQNAGSLTTLQGMPIGVTGSFFSLSGAKVLDALPRSATRYEITQTSVDSLVGIHKMVREAESFTMIHMSGTQGIATGGLGLLMIKGLKSIACRFAGDPSGKVLKFLQEHLNTSDRDIVMIQDQMIDLGLGQWARL